MAEHLISLKLKVRSSPLRETDEKKSNPCGALFFFLEGLSRSLQFNKATNEYEGSHYKCDKNTKIIVYPNSQSIF